MENNFETRQKFGKIAEKMFEVHCLINDYWYYNYGINKDIPTQVQKYVPEIVKKTPDYMMVSDDFHFVECKMADHITGEHVKIKEKDLQQYNSWSRASVFLFFIYNLKFNESYFLELNDLHELIANNNYKTDVYPNNQKRYIEIPMDDIRRLDGKV